MQIIRDMRIRRAQTLLLHTSAKREDIARQTGYESQFSFSRAFKNKLGFGPQEFRRGGRSGIAASTREAYRGVIKLKKMLLDFGGADPTPSPYGWIYQSTTTAPPQS